MQPDIVNMFLMMKINGNVLKALKEHISCKYNPDG